MTKRLILMAALAGCAGSTNYWNPYTPVRATTTQPKAAAVQKAVVAMTDAGREIESSDGATGIVLSKWWSGDGFGGDQNRFRVRVSVDDAGGYEIAALCQTNNASNAGWSDDCDKTKRPQFVLDIVTKVDAAMNGQ